MLPRRARSTLFPLHDALPILENRLMQRREAAFVASLYVSGSGKQRRHGRCRITLDSRMQRRPAALVGGIRSEEHTSELQSQSNLVCRLLLEKKNLVDDLVELR